MTFLTSGLAIAGACAIAIPIIIHLLFRQRRKPIEWAAMRFLIEAFRKHKRRLRLEQILLLAVRCLIPLLLGFALAQPLLKGTILASATGSRAVYFIIDNGMTAGATGDDGKAALHHHIESAVEIIRDLSAGDAVGVITAARPARGMLIPPSSDHGSVIDLLQSIKPEQSPADVPGAFSVARAALDDARDRRESLIYLMSEFRTGSVALDSPPPAAALDKQDVKLFATPAAPTGLPNVQITAINPVRSLILPGANDGSGQISVRLARFGPQLPADVSRIRLSGEGLAPLEPAIVRWTPGQAEASAEFNASFTRQTDGQIGITVSLDNDALNADNQRFMVLESRKKVRVLLVDRRSFGFERSLDQLTAGQWIRRALEPLGSAADGKSGGSIEIVEVEPAALDVADIRTTDAVILPRPDLLNDNGWTIVKGFVHKRGLLILMPPGEANVHQWVEHIPKDLGLTWQIALEAAVHADGLALAEEQPANELTRLISSDLPELVRPVLAYKVLDIDAQSLTSGQAQPILLFSDGTPMMVAGTASGAPDPASTAVVSGGTVIYLAVAPELPWTTLPSKPMMVPLFHELIRQGLSAIRATQRYSVGEQPMIAAGPAATDLIGPQGTRTALDRTGRPQSPFTLAGLYGIVDQSAQPIGSLAVNVEPRAGQTDAQSQAAVSAWLAHAGAWQTIDPANAAASLGAVSSGSQLSGMLLAVVLGLVLLETLLARWFSHAHTGEGVGNSGRRGIKSVDRIVSSSEAIAT